MTTMTNFAQATRASHTQRAPDAHPKSRSVTGSIPARLAAKALADFMLYHRKAKDDETRAYCAAEIKRLGGAV